MIPHFVTYAYNIFILTEENEIYKDFQEELKNFFRCFCQPKNAL